MVAAAKPPPSVRAVLLAVCVAVTLSSCALASSPVGQPQKGIGEPMKGPIEVDCNSPLATGLQAKGWTVTPNNDDQGRCDATPPEPEGSR
jgi:hypothetical protein